MTWQDAAVVVVVLTVLVALTARSSRSWIVGARGFAREAAIVFALFGMWQYAAAQSLTRVTGAVAHGREVWHIERVLHLPSEVWLQRLILPYPSVVRFSNLYYAGLHFPITIAFLIWLWVRHRDRYPVVRNTIAIATGACLLVQMIPVAPPRMLPEVGFVDTAMRYGQSVYGSTMARGMADQLSAMPSIHVAWAVLVGVVVVSVSTSPWRWLAAVHAVLTILVVVVTANHFWADGIVAVALLGLGYAVATGVPRFAPALQARRAAPIAPTGVRPALVGVYRADSNQNARAVSPNGHRASSPSTENDRFAYVTRSANGRSWVCDQSEPHWSREAP